MRIAGMALAALVLSGGTATREGKPQKVQLGEAFELRPGGSARLVAEDLEVGFQEVVGDSRCARGVQCIRAGEATVRVWLRQGGGPKTLAEVQSTKQAVAVGDSDLAVRLLDLAPYPVAERRTEAPAYRATLEIVRGTDGPSAIQ
jgi:hypothetical protein